MVLQLSPTSKGVMTADSAKSQNCGGEILCTVEVINCPRIAKRTSNTKKWHVEINVSGQLVTFKGPKGEITLSVNPSVKINKKKKK